MGGTRSVSGGTVKAEDANCRAQELARSSAQENERQKKALTGLDKNRRQEQTRAWESL
jgi:hypothetical protein